MSVIPGNSKYNIFPFFFTASNIHFTSQIFIQVLRSSGDLTTALKDKEVLTFPYRDYCQILYKILNHSNLFIPTFTFLHITHKLFIGLGHLFKT